MSRAPWTKCSTAHRIGMRLMWARAPLPPRPASTPRRSSKTPTTYEHVAPERVGNRRRVMVSDQAGKSNVIAELERLGVPVEECDDGMDITGVERLGGGEMESFGDHRIAMSLSVAALVANGGITVKDIDCVATSFPTFFPLLEKVAVR